MSNTSESSFEAPAALTDLALAAPQRASSSAFAASSSADAVFDERLSPVAVLRSTLPPIVSSNAAAKACEASGTTGAADSGQPILAIRAEAAAAPSALTAGGLRAALPATHSAATAALPRAVPPVELPAGSAVVPPTDSAAVPSAESAAVPSDATAGQPPVVPPVVLAAGTAVEPPAESAAVPSAAMAGLSPVVPPLVLAAESAALPFAMPADALSGMSPVAPSAGLAAQASIAWTAQFTAFSALRPQQLPRKFERQGDPPPAPAAVELNEQAMRGRSGTRMLMDHLISHFKCRWWASFKTPSRTVVAAPVGTTANPTGAVCVMIRRSTWIQRVNSVNIKGDLASTSRASSTLYNVSDIPDVVDVSSITKLYKRSLHGVVALALLVCTHEQHYSGILNELIASSIQDTGPESALEAGWRHR